MSRPGNAWRRVHGRITKRPTNFSWLLEGRLAGSGMPTTRKELDWAVAQGVGSVLTMTEDPLPPAWTGDIGYMHVPTPDLAAPDMDGIDGAVDFVRGEIAAGRPVMVHCAAGMGRAGTILACYLVKYEEASAGEAIKRIRDARPGSIQSGVQETAIKLYEKHLAHL